MRAMHALWHHRSTIDLVGNHIDMVKGKWTAIEAGVDSCYEYLVKGATLLQRPELMNMFNRARGDRAVPGEGRLVLLGQH